MNMKISPRIVVNILCASMAIYFITSLVLIRICGEKEGSTILLLSTIVMLTAVFPLLIALKELCKKICSSQKYDQSMADQIFYNFEWASSDKYRRIFVIARLTFTVIYGAIAADLVVMLLRKMFPLIFSRIAG